MVSRSDKEIRIKLTTKNVLKTKKELAALNIEVKKLTIAQKKVALASAKVTLANKKAALAAKKLALANKTAATSTNFLRVKTSGLRRSVGALRNQLLLVTFATAGLIAAGKKVVGAFIEQENAVTKLEAALKSTGGVVGLTSNRLQRLAAELQKVTSFGDETIITAQSLLLTFTQIGGDVFPKALEAILNVSTAMGTDLQSSVLQLGKALNDPILGVAALTRVGIQLSATQKEQIKLFAKQGKTAKAQKIILGELETQFGDLARAMRETTEGEIKQMTMAFGDMMEVIGEGLAPAIIKLAKTLTPIFVKLNLTIGDFFGNLSEIDQIKHQIFEASDALKEFNRTLGVGHVFTKELTDEIAVLGEELNNLFAKELAEDRLVALIAWANGLDKVKKSYVEMIEKVKPLLGDLDDSIRVLDTTQQLTIDNVKTLTDGLIQATLYGQKFGDAIVASLKAIAAQLIKQAAIYLLMNLFTGRTASLAGFGMFATTGKIPMPLLNQPSIQPSSSSGVMINLNIANLVGTDEAAVRDQLVPILNRVMANA